MPASKPGEVDRRKRRWRRLGMTVVILLLLLTAARLVLPWGVRWYVNRALDQSLLYEGRIGTIHVNLLRGAYAIDDMRIFKVHGNVPVPLFSAKRVDIAIDSEALLAGRVVGRLTLVQPQLNFVAAEERSQSQTGAGTPWMQVISDLYPFDINSARIQDGAIHFRAFETDPPVDVYLSHVNGTVENLTNIRDESRRLVATIKADAMAMEQGKLQFEMTLDPFSYRPTFEMALRLIGLDVRKLNALTEAYAAFEAESGWFDLVIELSAKEGALEGYVKPLFRDLRIFSLEEDSENPLDMFWQGLLGATAELFKNQPRDQVATVIPFRGDVSDPRTSVLEVVGNVLRNAFIRAYLPRFSGTADVSNLQFGTGSIVDDPSTVE